MDEDFEQLRTSARLALHEQNLPAVSTLLLEHDSPEIVRLLEQQPQAADRAVLYRMLDRRKALEVFELLEPGLRGELLKGLRDEDVTRLFEELDPDDRAQLVDELPAGVAQRLLQGLSAQERELTLPLLGYPKSSIGRYMSPEYVRLPSRLTLGDALTHVRHRGVDAETIYMLPVTDDERRMEGVIGLTLVAVCTIAATVGGAMPMLARAVRADPAVFSTPFMSTFCDATSLIIYFLIATRLLNL